MLSIIFCEATKIREIIFDHPFHAFPKLVSAIRSLSKLVTSFKI